MDLSPGYQAYFSYVFASRRIFFNHFLAIVNFMLLGVGFCCFSLVFGSVMEFYLHVILIFSRLAWASSGWTQCTDFRARLPGNNITTFLRILSQSPCHTRFLHPGWWESQLPPWDPCELWESFGPLPSGGSLLGLWRSTPTCTCRLRGNPLQISRAVQLSVRAPPAPYPPLPLVLCLQTVSCLSKLQSLSPPVSKPPGPLVFSVLCHSLETGPQQ